MEVAEAVRRLRAGETLMPLEEVGKAHERLDSGHGRGKVVLRVAEE